jgi:zinc/manganese transport system ATP-binding protein
MNDTVVLENAGMRFGARWVWRHASFRVAAGSFTAVVGPNGAGKSTLLKALLGLLPLTEGRITVEGKPPRQGNSSIGYMPQTRPLEPELAIRGWDIARFGVDGYRWGFALPGSRERERTVRVRRALAAVGAERYASGRLGLLSGGEAQRIFLAQALVGDPRLLVLDEPLANLDPSNRTAMLALIASIVRRRRISALLVAHDINGLLPHIDTVVYVASGGIAAGTPDEVITSTTLSRIYGTEIEVLRDRRGQRVVLTPEHFA